MQLERNVLHRDAHDGADLLIAQAFEPKEDNAAVHQAQPIDAGIQALGLQRPVVRILKGVNVHAEGHPFAAPPSFLVGVEAAVERNPVNPRPDIGLRAERIVTLPEPDQYLLEEVVDLVRVLREHVAHRVDGALVLPDQLGEYLFLVIHFQSNLHPLDNKVHEKLYIIRRKCFCWINPDLSNASYALSMKSQYSSGNKYDAAGAFMPINPNLKDLSKRSFILLGMLLGVKKRDKHAGHQ